MSAARDCCLLEVYIVGQNSKGDMDRGCGCGCG